MQGHTQDVLNAVRENLQNRLDLSTATFSLSQRELANAVVGASMAALSWRSNTDPNEERRYELPRVAEDVTNTIFSAATTVAQKFGNTDEDFRAFVAGPRVQEIAAETKIAVLNLLDQRARGH